MVAYYKDILLIAFLATNTNTGKGRVVYLSLVMHPYLTKVGNPDKMFRHLPLLNLRESLYQLRLTYFSWKELPSCFSVEVVAYVPFQTGI